MQPNSEYPPGDSPLPDDIGQSTAEARSFDKPNLVLKDPDPYAFANRIRRLTFVLAGLCLLVVSPYLIRQFVYHMRYASLRADVDVATDGLKEISPSLEGFQVASRLVSKRIGPSVVSVQTPGFDGPEGQGSGVIVDEAGYLVTNYHVIKSAVENEKAPVVHLDDGRTVTARVVGVDPGTDMAVLKINAPDLIAAEWGDSDALEVGDLVWAVGSPFGLDRSMTFGIVSAKHRRSSSGVTETAYQEYLQTDVAINPGNSGGPLVDVSGKIVGINTAIIGRSYQGVSFSIPTTLAKKHYEVLRRDGRIERGYLGMAPTEVPESFRSRLGLERGTGVYVSRVLKPGPASNAGLRRGDVILKWNDYPAVDPTLLSHEIASTKVGSRAEVVVKRLEGGRPVEVNLVVKVGVAPNQIRGKFGQ